MKKCIFIHNYTILCLQYFLIKLCRNDFFFYINALESVKYTNDFGLCSAKQSLLADLREKR